jgi:hypothetical protein
LSFRKNADEWAKWTVTSPYLDLVQVVFTDMQFQYVDI